MSIFQKATGELFSERLNCAKVLSRSPGPIRTYSRVQALRLALINYLEAEVDDSNGPVPMKVGAMKGSHKKSDTGKKGYGKGNDYGVYGAKGEYSKSNEYGKDYEKGKDKGKQGKGKGPGKVQLRKPLQVTWQVGPQGERVLARLRSRSGGGCEFFRELGGSEHGDHNDGCEDDSCHSRGCCR